MAEESRQRSLGVLELTVGVEADVERALMVLRKLGLSDPSPALRNAVGVALMHSAYLGERRTVFPKVTKGLLDVLSNLGVTFLGRLVTIDAYQRAVWTSAGALNNDVNEVVSALPDWTARQEWLLRCAALGHTFAGGTPPPKVSAHLLRRIIGVLCLAGEETVASRLLEGLLSEVHRQRSTTVIDPKTTLQDLIAPSTAEYVYEREGPDHQVVFRAIVTDTRGRRGAGLGKNKKQAAQNAALDFLQRHIPPALLSPPTSETAPLPTRVALPEPRAHVLAVQRLRDLFGLPASATPLLSQALIHSSWAFEHRASMAKYHQQDNQVLGFVGAQAAVYEYARSVAYQIAADPPQEFAFRSLDNATKTASLVVPAWPPACCWARARQSRACQRRWAPPPSRPSSGRCLSPKASRTAWHRAGPQHGHRSGRSSRRPRHARLTRPPSSRTARARCGCKPSMSSNALDQITPPLPGNARPQQRNPKHQHPGDRIAGRRQDTGKARGVSRCPGRLGPARPTHSKSEMADATPNEIESGPLPASPSSRATRHIHRAAAALGRQQAFRPSPCDLTRATDLVGWRYRPVLDSRNTIETASARLEEAFRAVLEDALDHEEAIRTHLASTLETLEQISAPGI